MRNDTFQLIHIRTKRTLLPWSPGRSAGLLCLVIIIMMIVSAGCLQQSQTTTFSTADGKTDRIKSVSGIPLEMIEKAHLKDIWMVNQLPIGHAGRVKIIFYRDKKLFAIDNRNVIYAMDGMSGVIQWSERLGKIGGSCSRPYFYQDQMLFVVDNEIVSLRLVNGEIVYRHTVDFTPTTNAARNDDKIFIGGNQRRFYALRMSDGIPVWQSNQPASPTGRLDLADDKVFFTCLNGTLYASWASKRELVWSRATEGETPGVIVDNQQCFLPSSDTVLYCFAVADGNLIWKFHAGGSLMTLPVLTEKHVYQHVDQTSMVCLDRQSEDIKGSMRWRLPEGKTFLAEKENLSYHLTLDHRLVIMDNVAGKKILSFYVPGLDIGVVNNEDDMIFLANSRGTILALQPEDTQLR